MKQLRTPLLLAGLLTVLGAAAQPQKPKAPAPQKAVAATTMAQFRTTPEGVLRAQLYKTTFGGSKGEDTENIKYPDGSALHVMIRKNPSFANKPTSYKADVKKDQPKKTPDGKGGDFTCTTDHVKLTATSTTFLNNDYSTAASHIYPGACFVYKNFYHGYKEQEGARNPLTIITNNTNIKGSPYKKIDNPNMATIRAGLDELFNEATGPSATESFTYQIYETACSADESLKISGGASGWGASFSGSYGTGSHTFSRNITIDAIKTLFSVTTIPPKGGFFKEKSIESKDNLVVIGSVSYGVRILANFTLNFDSEKEAAGFSAAYSGFGVSAKVDLDQISNSKAVSSTINCYVIGGPGNSVLSFDKKDLKKEITAIMGKASYKTAMPVKFQFYDMAGDVVGTQSATDEFSVQECVPGKDNPKLINAYVTFNTGDEGLDNDCPYNVFLHKGDAKINKKSFRDGASFEFGTGKTHPAIEEKSKLTDKLHPAGVPLTLSDLRQHGGSVSIVLLGDDDWNINNVSVSLEFDGGKVVTGQIGSARLSDDMKYVTLYFDGDLKPR